MFKCLKGKLKHNIERRFAGSIAKEYKIVKHVYPDFSKFQGLIGKEISTYIPVDINTQIEIIEIGCGYGATAKIILQARKDSKFVTIDNEPEMIEQAKEYLDFWVKTRDFHIVYMDALEYTKQIKDEKIDIVASDLTLHNFKHEYRDNLQVEIFRVLKPGGIFINSDKYSQTSINRITAIISEIARFTYVFFKNNRYRTLKEWLLHHFVDQSEDRIMKEKESINNLQAIGFKEIDILYRKNMIAVIRAKKISTSQ